MTARTFSLGAVLTCTTGKLLAPGGISDLYELLNHMTGDSVYTHQLGRVSAECKPHLLNQFPALSSVNAHDVTPANFRGRLNAWIDQLGDSFDVEPLPKGAHEARDPVAELVDMVGADRVMVVTGAES